MLTRMIVPLESTPLRCAALLALTVLGGCTLHNDVAITPIFLLPQDVRSRGTNVVELTESGDFIRALAYAEFVETKEKPSIKELMALGSAYLAAGRLDDARRHLREAVDLKAAFEDRGRAAWLLSQTEYLANNYAASAEWARIARENGLTVRDWHIDYLESVSGVRIYEMSSWNAATIDMAMGNPDIPRLGVQVNGAQATAVLDSGAVMTILSESMAKRAGVRSLGEFRGEFLGLLGEPIPVRFGMIDSLQLGDLTVRNVPVAVMHDSQLDFVVYNREPFRMELLLGANLLKEFRVELDYRHEVLTFQPIHPQSRTPVEDQNLFFVGFRPFVQAAINRKGWYLFVVDTGSEVTFLNDQKIDSTPIRRALRLHGATLQGLGGAKKSGEKVENVEVGVDAWGGLFKNIPLYTAEQSGAYGILGQNFMKNFRVVIDFGAMRLDLYRDRGPFRQSVFETARQ